MKILFLDIDGVLNDRPLVEAAHAAAVALNKTGTIIEEPSFDMYVEMIKEEFVTNLNTILDRTGAKVVVSSTWRKVMPMDMLQRVLDTKGFKHTLFDRTESSHKIMIQDGEGTWRSPKFSQYTTRGLEIAWWLHNHPEVTQFVVLDDDCDIAPLEDNWVRTYYQNHWMWDGELGLTEEATNKAIEVLNG